MWLVSLHSLAKSLVRQAGKAARGRIPVIGITKSLLGHKSFWLLREVTFEPHRDRVGRSPELLRGGAKAINLNEAVRFQPRQGFQRPVEKSAEFTGRAESCQQYVTRYRVRSFKRPGTMRRWHAEWAA